MNCHLLVEKMVYCCMFCVKAVAYLDACLLLKLVNVSAVQLGSVQDYQVSTDDGVGDEKDRRQQHIGVYC